MKTNGEYAELEALARRGRWLAISTVAYSGAGHVGGPFSAMDLMIALYFRVMKIDPQTPDGRRGIVSFFLRVIRLLASIQQWRSEDFCRLRN